MVHTNLTTAVDHLMAPPLTVAVIGAGAAGLAVGRALKTEGHEFVIYEKSEKLGGTWLYDPRVESDPLSLDPNREIVHSSLYHSLRTNLPRELMGFPDYPFSTEKNRDPRTFPGHEEVLQFLNEFATKFGLVESIRFKTEVIRVERVDLRNDRWVVESRNNESSSNELFNAVVVCNGHYTIPNVADFPVGRWALGGRWPLYSARWPSRGHWPLNSAVACIVMGASCRCAYAVVVIGDGPSARDISIEISDVAKQVHLSSRSLNIDVSNFEYRDNMWQHSKIDEANENGEVVFEDGVVVKPDIILHCTGFKYDFPFLKSEGIITVEDGRVGPLYKHVFPPTLGPNLSFVGLPYRTIIMQMIDFEAKWVARVLSGRARLPSTEEMEAEVQRHYREMEEKGIPKHHTHCLHFQLDYLDWLANEVGLEGVDETSRSIVNWVILKNPQWRGQIVT
ncbi:hypothetical protein C2S52_018462 [Perilla frutescens var. hirtella]|nr:hypothetical protein C2S52_018462 [Perilla frutescens var. hirtella]